MISKCFPSYDEYIGLKYFHIFQEKHFVKTKKKSVKALRIDRDCLKCVCTKFPHSSDAKLKESFLVEPDIHFSFEATMIIKGKEG